MPQAAITASKKTQLERMVACGFKLDRGLLAAFRCGMRAVKPAHTNEVKCALKRIRPKFHDGIAAAYDR